MWHVQQGELVLPPDECVLLVNQHEPLLHHGLLLFLVVAFKIHTETEKNNDSKPSERPKWHLRHHWSYILQLFVASSTKTHKTDEDECLLDPFLPTTYLRAGANTLRVHSQHASHQCSFSWGGLTRCLLLNIEETLLSLYCRLIRLPPVPQHALEPLEVLECMIAASSNKASGSTFKLISCFNCPIKDHSSLLDATWLFPV